MGLTIIPIIFTLEKLTLRGHLPIQKIRESTVECWSVLLCHVSFIVGFANFTVHHCADDLQFYMCHPKQSVTRVLTICKHCANI